MTSALQSLLLILLALGQGYAQPAISRISVSDSLLKSHIFALASTSFRGRETGTDGQQKAAHYCVQSFRQSHLSAVFRIDSIAGSFRQPFFFTSTRVNWFGAGSGFTPGTINQYELLATPPTAKGRTKAASGSNVAGLLMGTDLKHEVLVISAHYDHLGRVGGSIHPGADDNASGTATVLSVASVFDSLARQGIRNRRSLLFVLFSGEEQGLLGSQHFVNNSPIPLQQIIGNINIDMVGRTDADHGEKPDYCYLITGNRDSILRKAVAVANNQSVAIELNYTYDTDKDPNQYFYRSDHFNFARFGIPVLFFFDGHHPDYHRPSDTADKIDYAVLKKRATLVFQTAWTLVNLTF